MSGYWNAHSDLDWYNGSVVRKEVTPLDYARAQYEECVDAIGFWREVLRDQKLEGTRAYCREWLIWLEQKADTLGDELDELSGIEPEYIHNRTFFHPDDPAIKERNSQ